MTEKKQGVPVQEPVPAEEPAKAGDNNKIWHYNGKFPVVVDYLVFFGIFLLAQGLGTAVAWLAGCKWPDPELLASPDEAISTAEQIAAGHFNAVTYFVSMSVTLAGFLFYRRRRHGPTVVARFSRRGLNPVLLLWGVFFMLSTSVVLEPFLSLMPEVPNVYGRGAWAIVTVVVMAPLFEEVIFRGVLLESTRVRYGVVAAWLLSSAIFGIVHVHPTVVVNAFVMGLVLAFIYLRTDSLWSAIILHAINNGIAYLARIMTLRTKIAVVAATLFLAGCQELPGYFASDTTLARAGGSELKMRDVESVVPKGVTGEDSAAFMKVYVDRWVRKQLKLQEAEILFSASADDIDKMVEEYRQALLIRKLDQHYVDRSIDTTFTENEIAAYYNAHKADFRLDRTLVKGRIVQFGEGYRQARKLRELMGTKSEARQQDFRDICAKNDFTVTDFSDQWVDFPEFLSYLPTLRSQNYDPVLASTAVQEMRDSHSHYYFQIEAVRREGEPIPPERLRGIIRRILFNQRQGEIIRRHEEELSARATENGEVKIFDDERAKDN